MQVPGEVVIMIGDFLEYECENGYVHVTGNLLRACLESGMLSGSPPVCAGTYDKFRSLKTAIIHYTQL